MSQPNAWDLIRNVGVHPHVIAHRGASGYAPENTVAAYAKAIDLGITAVETDVHQTADGEIVTIHDATLDRTTNGSGAVVDAEWADVQTLDAGSWYDSTFSAERVPNLDAYLAALAERAVPVIELKGGQTVVDRLAERFGGSRGGAFFFSFKDAYIKRLKALCPDCPALYLAEWTEEEKPCPLTEALRAAEMGMDAVGVHWPRLTPAFVHKAHDLELRVFVYTVNDEPGLEYVLNCDVDGIISDYPDQLIQWMNQRKNR